MGMAHGIMTAKERTRGGQDEHKGASVTADCGMKEWVTVLRTKEHEVAMVLVRGQAG